MEKKHKLRWQDTAWTILVLLGVSFVGWLFHKAGFGESNIIMVYILGVLVTAVLTYGRIYSMISSVVSVLLFNFLFTDPRFTFDAYDAGYTVTFLIMFFAAVFSGSLAVKIKRQAEEASAMAYRTKILLETNQLLQKADSLGGILRATAEQLQKLLERTVVCYEGLEDGSLNQGQVFLHSQEKETADFYLTPQETTVATWVFQNNTQAGAQTKLFPESKCRYLAVRGTNHVFCVYGIAGEKNKTGVLENNLLLSILGECALALEKELLSRKREEAATQAKNEQLRANLLRGISHDLRTPLTSISGNASMLLASGGALGEERRQNLYLDIYDDSMWLINLVENLLCVTRIENGTMQLHLQGELVDEVVSEALRHVDRRRMEHEIRVIGGEEILLAKMDPRLVIQVIINIVDNAIKYTPKGSEITITIRGVEDKVRVSIADNGPGIPMEKWEKIFEMFFTSSQRLSDSRRGLGLGLPLCKSVILAHGGEIWVTENQPHGTIFHFTLEREAVMFHE